MARTARSSAGEVCYHVIIRGNGRARVFHDPADYAGFVDTIDGGEAPATFGIGGSRPFPYSTMNTS